MRLTGWNYFSLLFTLQHGAFGRGEINAIHQGCQTLFHPGHSSIMVALKAPGVHVRLHKCIYSLSYYIIASAIDYYLFSQQLKKKKIKIIHFSSGL